MCTSGHKYNHSFGLGLLRKLAVAVAQLVEQLLPTLEVPGLNPVISKIYIEHCLL